MMKNIKNLITRAKDAWNEWSERNPIDNPRKKRLDISINRYLAKRVVRKLKHPTLFKRLKIWWYWKFHSLKSYGIPDSRLTRIDKFHYWYDWVYDKFDSEEEVVLKNPLYKTEGCYDSLHLYRDLGRAWSRLIWNDMSKLERFLVRLKIFWIAFIR